MQQWLPLGGVSPSRYETLLGGTLDWRFSPHTSVLIDYEQQFAQHDSVRMMTLDYRWMF